RLRVRSLGRGGGDGLHLRFPGLPRRQGRGAFLDLRGRRVPLPGNERFEYLGEDRFAAHRKEAAALFTEKGRQLTGFILSQVRPFQSGTATVQIGAVCGPKGCSGGKWQLIDRSARSVADPFSAIVEQTGSQVVLVQEKGSSTVWNRQGKVLDGKTYRKLEFVDARWSEGGGYYVKGETNQGMTILIDKDGNRIYQGLESAVIPGAVVHRFTKQRLDGLISPSGEIRLPADYQEINRQSNGYFAIQNADGWGLADPAGKMVLPPQCERLDFQKQFVTCEKPEQVWLYNYQGKIINPLPYSKYSHFFRGPLIACRNRECSLLREDGTPAFTLTAEIQGCNSSMKACVFQGPKKSGAVDFQGQEILEPPAQKMPENDRFFHQKVCTETCEEHWILLDKDARELARRKYDFVDNFVDGFARVSRGARPHHNFGYASPTGGRWGIIDVRGNRGGNIDSWIIGTLLRKVWAYWPGPEGKGGNSNMQQTFRGHLAVLINEGTYSDGETFAAGVKALDLAPLIGTRTAGAGIWLSDRNPLVDGGQARVAEFAQYGADGRWLLEGNGVSPDIAVDTPPRAAYLGEDAQIARALAYLDGKIAAEPIPRFSPRPLPPLGEPGQDVR
ncbi:MAG: WG repeat-containing protein, partial [Alphaproteobacteria bacterium]|nr:WG repeat-containing protein [Alphaproteobacteria bacterium]